MAAYQRPLSKQAQHVMRSSSSLSRLRAGEPLRHAVPGASMRRLAAAATARTATTPAPALRRSARPRLPNWRGAAAWTGGGSSGEPGWWDREEEDGSTSGAPQFDPETSPTVRTAEALAERLPLFQKGRGIMLTKLQYMHTTQQLPDTYIGPIELAESPGRGWGLVATSLIQPGDPILICPPLALAAGPPGQPPSLEDLQAAIQSARWLGPTRRLLEALTDGTTPRPSDAAAAAAAAARAGAAASAAERRRVERAAARKAQQERDLIAMARAMRVNPETLRAAFAAQEDSLEGEEEVEEEGQEQHGTDSSGIAGEGASEEPPRPPPIPKLRVLAAGLSDERTAGRLGSRLPLRIAQEQLASVLRANAYADVWQDLAATTARGEAPTSVTGLWPLFALANHSCIPNAAHAVIGSTRAAGDPRGAGDAIWDVLSRPGLGPRMVVRAARRIGPGEEIAINYLGRGVLAPADQRRAELASTWGFQCSCPRCQAELSLSPVLQDTIESTARAAAELAPLVSEAATNQDAATLESAAAALAAVLGNLEEACSEMGVRPSQMQAVHGATFEARHVLATARMAREPRAVKSLAALAAEATLAGVLLPGSDLHTLTAARLVGVLRSKHGARDRATQEAAAEALEAHKLRYGPMELSLARDLLETSITWADRLAVQGTDVAAAAAQIAAEISGGEGIAAAAEAAEAAEVEEEKQRREGRRKKEQNVVHVGTATVAGMPQPAVAAPKTRGRPRKTAAPVEHAEDPSAAAAAAAGGGGGGAGGGGGGGKTAAGAGKGVTSSAQLEQELLSRQQWQDPNPLAPPRPATRRTKRSSGASMKGQQQQQQEEAEQDEVEKLLAEYASEVRDLTPEEIAAAEAEANAAAEAAALKARQQKQQQKKQQAKRQAAAPKKGIKPGGSGLLDASSLPLLSRWMAGGQTAGSAAEADGLTPEALSRAMARLPGSADVELSSPGGGSDGGGGLGGSEAADRPPGSSGGSDSSPPAAGSPAAAGTQVPPLPLQQQQQQQQEQQVPVHAPPRGKAAAAGKAAGSRAPLQFDRLGAWRARKAAAKKPAAE